MAFFTGQRRVLSSQRKARQIMIKQYPVLPGHCIVAAIAFVTHPFAVRIIISMAADTSDRRQFNFGGLLVAGFAQGDFMGALQGEVGHLVMIELGILPILVIVAFFAIGTVASLVTVVFLVAADARHRRLFDASVGTMAACTRRGSVRAKQGKARFLGVIEFHILPIARCVAIGAGGSALTFVRVVLGVAGDAGFLRFANRVVGAVAACARRSSMLAQQRERCVAIVVERRRFPVGRVMAGRAIGAARSLVDIVARMAADALLREPLPTLAGMAAHTIGAAMLAGQRKTGFGMIVRQDGLPACHRMATLAVSA